MDPKSMLHGNVSMENKSSGVTNSPESGDAGEAARKASALDYISAGDIRPVDLPELIDLKGLDDIYPKA